MATLFSVDPSEKVPKININFYRASKGRKLDLFCKNTKGIVKLVSGSRVIKIGLKFRIISME